MDTDPNTHAEDPQRLPQATTPVWESELLISAAVVFALFAAPGAIDVAFDKIGGRLGGHWYTFAYFIALYAKIVTLVLIVTFVSHLVARGFWTALVGLRSIYPGGIRWDKLPDGPNFLEVTRARTRPVADLIERVDNFAGAIFAFGALLVLFAVGAFVVTLGFFVVTGLLLAFVPIAARNPSALLWGALGLAVGPLALAAMLDRTIGRRMPRDGAFARTIRLVARVFGRMPLSSVAEPMRLTFTSNLPRWRGMPLMIGGLYAVIGLAMVDTMVHRDEVELSSYAYLPEEGGERSLDPRHYASQRRESKRWSNAPFIQSDVIRDPYVRLFVPYTVDRHTYSIATACPALPARPLEDEAAEAKRRTEVLACVATLLNVEFDGKPVASLELEFATDPESDHRGFLAMVPTAGLARGRHELALVRLPRTSARIMAAGGEKPKTDRIVFWL